MLMLPKEVIISPVVTAAGNGVGKLLPDTKYGAAEGEPLLYMVISVLAMARSLASWPGGRRVCGITSPITRGLFNPTFRIVSARALVRARQATAM
jgi:hypothetical protein